MVQMSRSRAALTHLVPIMLVLAVIASVVVFAWYPYPFWQFGKSGKFALSLIIAAGFAGPALTWVVYKKGKRGLMFDLWVIAIVQLAAITWGTLAIYQSRPFWMVHTVDRFEVLSMRDVDPAWVTDPKFLDKPFVGPLLLFANMPADPVGYQKLLREIMFEGMPDIQFRPEFWSLYSEGKETALQKSRPLVSLRDARPDSSGVIDKVVKNHGGDITLLKFVPVLQKDGEFSAILDAQSGDVIDTLMIDPWID
jgi:hypothetical protein